MTNEVIIVQPIIPRVVITSPGPQGPSGAFQPGDIAYTHTQAQAANIWTITHNLGFNPTAVIMDSAGTNCEGEFAFPTVNTMTITFNSAFAGTAYLI
tara:strand:+ start:2883 stop:3173 length:291 start_codon:yes stop_codon:yes gene_type:complete